MASVSVEEGARVRGALLGLAVGDALGASYEFESAPLLPRELVLAGGGPWQLAAGEWTDDTSMALCLAESLVARAGFDAHDQMERYCRWYLDGHLSSKPAGHPHPTFDVGNTVRAALERYLAGGRREPLAGATDPRAAGNGSLMRLAPVALFFRHDPRAAVHLAGESSRTTHGAREAIDACRYFAALLVGACLGRSKEELVGRGPFEPVPGLWSETPLAPEIAAIAAGRFRALTRPRSSGYVVHTLEAALWAFERASDFAGAVRAALALGGDTDTTAAVVGQLAGAHLGADAIPHAWRTGIAHRELIEGLAQDLQQRAPA